MKKSVYETSIFRAILIHFDEITYHRRIIWLIILIFYALKVESNDSTLIKKSMT